MSNDNTFELIHGERAEDSIARLFGDDPNKVYAYALLEHIRLLESGVDSFAVGFVSGLKSRARKSKPTVGAHRYE